MLLVPGDFGGPGWHRAPGTLSWQWALAMPDCGQYKAADYPAQRHRDSVETGAFEDKGQVAREWVEHFPPGWAPRNFDDARRVVETCPRYEYGTRSPGAPGFLESHWIEAQAFVGDQSMLIGTNRVNPTGGSFKRYTAMVRVGDWVATIDLATADTDTDGKGMQVLARRAAAHLE